VDEVIIVDENNSHTTTRKVKDALIKNRISDYVAIKHPEEEGKVLVLKRGDAERQAHIIVAITEWNLMIV
jgi:hypothetical protein